MRGVSIPSSSGHQFTVIGMIGLENGQNTAFQSLLHQGISLLYAKLARKNALFIIFVSIPSSSGHQFTVPINTQ